MKCQCPGTMGLGWIYRINLCLVTVIEFTCQCRMGRDGDWMGVFLRLSHTYTISPWIRNHKEWQYVSAKWHVSLSSKDFKENSHFIMPTGEKRKASIWLWRGCENSITGSDCFPIMGCVRGISTEQAAFRSISTQVVLRVGPSGAWGSFKCFQGVHSKMRISVISLQFIH